MPKTLADMTEEESAQCRGMWCDFPDPNERTNLAIYIGESTKHDGFCEIIHEGELGYITLPETLTPRFDLPRAWNPDGTPPEGQWSYANDAMGEFGNIPEDEVQEFLDANDPSFERRWVGEWEKA